VIKNWLTVLATIASAIELNNQEKDRQLKADSVFWAKVTGIGTTIAAVSGTLAAGFFAWQSINLQRQVRDNELQQAASVSVENLTVSGFPDRPVVSFDLKNAGPTRAENVTADPAYLWTSPAGVMQLFDKGFGGRSLSSDLGFSIGPSEVRHMTTQMRTAIPSDDPNFKNMPSTKTFHVPTRDDILSGKMVSVYAVTVTYKDIWGNVQHVSDCIVYNGSGFAACFGENRHRSM